MSQNSWIQSKPELYQVPKILIDQEIQKVLQSIKKIGDRQVELQFRFKRQSDLQKFMKLYQQQLYQEQYDYQGDEKNKQQNKFKRCKDIDQKQYDVRQLAFPSFHFVNIFMKIYQTRLKQMEIEYHYRFFMNRDKFKVYFLKGDKISSFFKNEIFEMKTKLNLYYCNIKTVNDKIKYSPYFNSLVEKKSIAAEYHKRLNKIDVAIFYSKEHEKKSIIEIVNKNLLEHMSILDFQDKRLKIQTNQIVFKLLYALLSDKIKKIQREEDIIIQANYEMCCILVHDRHQCFVDSKNQILAAIEKMITFRLDGNDMRTLFNKIIRNHQKYPFLRVKYSHRSLYCVIDCPLLESNRKYLTYFLQLLQDYFQSFNEKSHITLYLKMTKYPDFLNFFTKVSADKNITIFNFNEFMINDGYEMSKIMIGVKDIGQLNIVKTRRDLFETFFQIIMKSYQAKNILQNVYTKFDNLEGVLGFLDATQYSILFQQTQSQAEKSQNLQLEKLNQNISPQKVNQQDSLNQSQNTENVQQLGNRAFSYRYKQRQKKPKHIDLTYEYKSPLFDPQSNSFWTNEIRQRKLQKALSEKYNNFFGDLKYKTYKLALKQKIEIPPIQEFQKDRIYISTIIQKNNEICHHLIDLTEFSKLCHEVNDKTFFIFYKLANEQIYFPSYTINLI